MFQGKKKRYAWRLRKWATRRKVARSILDGVIGIFDWRNPSSRIMTLGSTQPLIEIGGKGGQRLGLTTLPLSFADFLEIWEAQPPGTLRTCPGL